MELDEAYETLELDEGVERDQVSDRFQELVKIHHPDSGGDEETFDKITKARDTVMRNVDDAEIVPYSPSENPFPLPDRYEQKRSETKTTIKRIKRKQTSHHRRRIQVLKIFGVFFGMISAIVGGLSIFVSGFQFEASQVLVSIWSDPFGRIMILPLLSFLFTGGIYYWILRVRIQNTEMIITEAEESLEQKSNIVRLLDELPLNPGDGMITGEDFQHAFQEWFEHSEMGDTQFDFLGIFGVMPQNLNLHTLAHQIGPADFQRIFLRKSIEHGIIEETVDSDGEVWSVQYEITI